MDAQNLLRPQVITGSGTGADTPQTGFLDGRARAIVFIGALSAGTTFAAKIEHADDDGVWADLPGAVFAPLTSPNTGTDLALDGRAAKKFVRLSYTATGGTPNLVACAFFVGFRSRNN